MGNIFKDLTKEELGRLFPIEISSYSKRWPVLFEKEKKLIIESLEPGLFCRIEHFGSTSVPGLSAKNTIDILMEVEFEEAKNRRLIQQLETLGYAFNWQNEGGNSHMVFVKGYHLQSPKTQTYHIHAGPAAHSVWDRMLFRDYLIKYPEIAAAYEKLKLKLSAEFKAERVAYRMAKTEFVNHITAKAKLEL